MKHIFLKIVISCAVGVGMSACTSFLDQVPDSVTFNEEQVFTDYTKSQQFVDQLLVPFAYLDDNWNNTATVSGFFGKQFYGTRDKITDNGLANTQSMATSAATIMRAGDFMTAETYGGGTMFYECADNRFNTLWKGIRICNLSIANIDKIENATPEQKNKILGLAYFMRGHFYFMLLQGWGGMPWIDKPLDPSSNMDLPRDTYVKTAQNIANDFATSANYLPDVVDDKDWGRPSRMAALAYKGKALLWAASPYANPANDKKLWEDAALALGDALTAAQFSGYYRLVSAENFKKLFVDITDGEPFHEVLFGRLFANKTLVASPFYAGILSTAFKLTNSSGGESPSENLAQCYGWSNGEPIDPTSAEYLSSPFTGNGVNHTGRDPRFYQTMLYNGADNSFVKKYNRKVEIWNKAYDNKPAEELKLTTQKLPQSGYTMTGYYVWKLYGEKFTSTTSIVTTMSNFIRLADVYLYYAEAANRAWGATSSPSGITAVQAINEVRRRVGMPDYDPASSQPWLVPGDEASFEQKIRNEIRIETAYEDKRFYDLRRWRMMTDPTVQQTQAMYIEKTAANTFKYSIVNLDPIYNLQWQEKHYLFPFAVANVNIGPNFKQNPGW